MSLWANGHRALLALLIAGWASEALPAQEAPPSAPPEAPAGPPTSLLPDMFEAPPAASPSEPAPEAGPGAAPGAPSRLPAPLPFPGATVAGAQGPGAADPGPDLPTVEVPAGPVRPAERAGLISSATGGLSPLLFAGSDGRFLAGLLVRLQGPLASRWAQILVQRALATQADPPPGIDAGDWLAARARALVALGLATDAHRMVMRVERPAYSPRLYAAAAQAALAAGDPVGLCPLAAPGRALSDDNAAFVLADAMCSALAGDPFSANELLEQSRRERLADPFDIQLAERVASLAGGTRGAGNPVWAEVDRLSAWRIGLAGAAGIALPDSLVDAAGATERAWMVRLPRVALATRARLAPEAGGIGALSADEVQRILALAAAGAPVGEIDEQPGGRLRRAQVAPTATERLAALEALWASVPADSMAAWGLKLASGAAAATIAPAPAQAAAAPGLIAAMVAAGHSGPASDWWPILSEVGGDPEVSAWAMLAAIDPDVPASSDRLTAWAANRTPAHAALVRGGLNGLGRDVGAVPPDPANAWASALDAAVRARRPGEVLLLAATGLQGSFDELSPDQFRRIVAALVAAGFGEEAQLIVAEAAARG
jgi:hypothetical protein